MLVPRPGEEAFEPFPGAGVKALFLGVPFLCHDERLSFARICAAERARLRTVCSATGSFVDDADGRRLPLLRRLYVPGMGGRVEGRDHLWHYARDDVRGHGLFVYVLPPGL